MSEEDRKTVEAMAAYGGSFVQALAEAARSADCKNFEIIKQSWPGYWKQYREMAGLSE